MSVRVNYWQPKTGPGRRWYVNSIPGEDARVWFEPNYKRPGQVSLKIEGHLEETTHTDILSMVCKAIGVPVNTEINEALLMRHVSPAQPQPPAGGGQGQRQAVGAAPGPDANPTEQGRAGLAAGRRQSVAQPPPPRPPEPPYEGWITSDADATNPNSFIEPLPEPLRLLVDRHEPEDMVFKLKRVPNLQIEMGNLDVGGYVIPGKLIIQRRDADQFIDDIRNDNRSLFWQTAELGAINMPAVMLLEGDIYRTKKMSMEALMGVLSYITVVQRLSVIPVLCPAHTVGAIVRLARTAAFGLGYTPDLRSNAPADASAIARWVLEGIPGISPRRAHALLMHFGTIGAIVEASEDDLCRVRGVAPHTARQILEALQFPYAEAAAHAGRAASA